MRRLIVAAVCFMLVPPVAWAQFSDQAVEKAIEKGVAFLLKAQQKDGSWGIFGDKKQPIHYQVTGPTALASYALMETDVSPQNPKIASALKWLEAQKEDKTYSLGLRANAWLAANRTTRSAYYKHLEKDVLQLYRSTRNGSYHYPATGTPVNTFCNSNSQYGVLGLWAGVQGNAEVPSEIWKRVMGHWERTQNRDGGWPYNNGESTAAMTAGGVATLYVCLDSLFNAAFLECKGNLGYKPIKAGLEWLDKNFTATMKGQKLGHSDMPYYLYALERTGLASGMKYFGKSDWYKAGATWLVKQQAGDGSWNGKWGKTVATGYALLFLIRGRNPVVFNKLEHGGDWNNRPRDLASATLWMSHTFERAINWQIINPAVPVSEWHDAPILYIAGSRKLELNEEQEKKLRTYVEQGGTIVSCSECGGLPFRKAITALYAKLFPEYKLEAIPNNHILYTNKVYFDLPGDRLKFQIITNGVRPLVIHTDVDLPLAWQGRRVATQKYVFEAAANLVRYVSDSVSELRPRGTSHWPDNAGSGHTRTVKLVRLKHGGQFDPEPLAYERFARLLGQRTKTKLEVEGPIEIEELAKSQAKLAVMTGVGSVKLTQAQKDALKAFVEKKGGTLLIDAAGGDRDFATAMENAIVDMFGLRRLRPLALGAPLYKLTGNEIAEAEYRRSTKVRLGRSKAPNLKAILVGADDRAGVLFSAEDITAGLVGYPSFSVDGYAPESAYQLLRNIVLSVGK
ncbi:MAG TPA: DUF4159 domain-containing protein [Phycisphaerae bacterium]|nr:DUF4159 domain-containing protein [Phycisphaerae bacterium]